MNKTGLRDDASLAAIRLEWWPRSNWNRWPPSSESAPAVRRLGEFLLIHHHKKPFKRKPFRRVPYQTLKKDFAITEFSYLESDVPARPCNPSQFRQSVPDHSLPSRFG